MRIILDEGQPFIGLNQSTKDVTDADPLQFLVGPNSFAYPSKFDYIHKLHLLLERGADVRTRDRWGRNCLHMIMENLYRHNSGNWDIIPGVLSGLYDELKDALMSMVTAGADINASECLGRSVSHYACESHIEELWIEVLAECGYDPEPFISYMDNLYREEIPGCGIFPTLIPSVRSTKLSFKEYSKQRLLIPHLVHPQRCNGVSGILEQIKWKDEWDIFVESLEESSDSEDEDIYSVEHGEEWWKSLAMIEEDSDCNGEYLQ